MLLSIRDLYHLSIAEGAPEFNMPEKALTFTQLITALKNRKLIDADPEIEPSNDASKNSTSPTELSQYEKQSASHRAEVVVDLHSLK